MGKSLWIGVMRVVCLLLVSVLVVEAARSDFDDGEFKLMASEKNASRSPWQPENYQFSRYQKMLSKDPFGKVPLKALTPAKVEEPTPVEEKQWAIAAVSVVEGKPVVYLIDLKTRAYQKINSEEENESKIKLVDLSEASNPRDVVAKVMINGTLSTVKYDDSILSAKPKSASKKKGRPLTVTRNAVPPRTNTTRAQNTVRTSNGHPPMPNAAGNGAATPPHDVANGRTPAAGGQPPANRSVQERRRLSSVPRRRVIVPGRSVRQP